MNNKILLVEDDLSIGLLVKESFETRGYEVIHAENGEIGYNLFNETKPDVCIVDIMMPLKDGFTLVEEVRKDGHKTPILFLTAKSKKEDLIKGFKVGIDDYVKKPFSMEELLVRIEALIRRSSYSIEKTENIEIINIGEYIFDINRQELNYKGSKKKLTGKETELLKLLFENINGVLDRNIALKQIWGNDDFFNARSMDVFISKLRKFLNKDSSIEIINIRGKGYKLITG
jgi:DNA-binding response OmpR family regulator